MGKQPRRADVPRIGNNESGVAFVKRAENNSFFFLCSHWVLPFQPACPDHSTDQVSHSARVGVITAGFLRDLLSDGSGYSFHRFQIFAWMLVLLTMPSSARLYWA